MCKAIDFVCGLCVEFWCNVRVLGAGDTFNQSLEKAGRVVDFFEFGEFMCIDVLYWREFCGGHFWVESQTEDGEAKCDDANFCYVVAWEFGGSVQGGDVGNSILYKEDFVYEAIVLKEWSYK